VHVRWIELVAFRSHSSLTFTPDPGLNTLVGRNGQGKTSILEAIHILLTGRSFRTPRLAECIAWDAAAGVRLAGTVIEDKQRRDVRLEIVGRDGGADVRGDLCRWARVVSFAALDLGLLAGPPHGRRGYLDGVASKLTPAHGESCRRYRLVLHQRSRLLADLAARADAERLLGPWDEQLATLGADIVHRRLETLAALAGEIQSVVHVLAPAAPPVSLTYEPSIPPGVDRSSTRAALAAALAAARPQELRRGLTLVGPHRDDVAIRLGRADGRTAASRGEQRLLALALRLAEAAAVRRHGAVPILLLDDVLSEFDAEVRSRLLDWLAAQGQVLLTATDAVPEVGAGGTVWDVGPGQAVGRAPVERGAA
jgi:DNA replication and repair protein RecF